MVRFSDPCIVHSPSLEADWGSDVETTNLSPTDGKEAPQKKESFLLVCSPISTFFESIGLDSQPKRFYRWSYHLPAIIFRCDMRHGFSGHMESRKARFFLWSGQ